MPRNGKRPRANGEDDEKTRALDDLQDAIDKTMDGGDETAHDDNLRRARDRLHAAEGRPSRDAKRRRDT